MLLFSRKTIFSLKKNSFSARVFNFLLLIQIQGLDKHLKQSRVAMARIRKHRQKEEKRKRKHPRDESHRFYGYMLYLT